MMYMCYVVLIVYGVLVGGVCVCIASLEHKEQVSVLLSSATVEVAKVGGGGIGDII